MAETRTPIITLTTDFGTADPYVASIKAAIYEVTTQVHIVDITHDVPPHDIAGAAYQIRAAAPLFPARTVHIVVVDPGVGSERRPIVVSSSLQYFVGPDNGVFSLIYEGDPTARTHHITATHYFRAKPSATFHGRDVFAPIAGQIIRGIAVENFGEPVEDPVRIELPKPKITAEGRVRATVIYVDRFGNVITNLTRAALDALMERLGRKQVRGAGAAASVVEMRRAYAEGPAGTPFFLFNSNNDLEIAVREARAADVLGLKLGDAVEIHLI